MERMIEATQRFDKEMLIWWHERQMKVMEEEYGCNASGEELQSMNIVMRSALVEACGGGSSVPLQGLQPISLSQLTIGCHHKGRVLFGQLCVHAFKVSSVQTVLAEPNHCRAARLAIYNAVTSSHKLSSIRRMFPKGARLAIKEPYFKRALDGGLALRVDNPTNVELFPADDLPPVRSLDPSTPQQLRNQANVLFRMGDWKEAERLYGSCISLLLSMISHTKMMEKLSTEGVDQNGTELLLALSNRSEARLQLQYHEKALVDAARALELSPKHIKSLSRKGRALLHLHQYNDAAACFETALQLSPANSKELQATLHDSRERNKQSITGKYDLVSLCKHVDQQEDKGDAAFSSAAIGGEFIGDALRFGMAERCRGRGLFVKRDVKCGELLLVSTAVAMARAPEGLFGVHVRDRACISLTQHDDLIAKVIDRVRNSARIKQQVYSLTSGANYGDASEGIPEMSLFHPNMMQREMDMWCSAALELEKSSSCGDVDVDRIRDIVRTNAFQHSTTSDSVGLWVMPAFINHSCMPNAFFLFFGDTLFVRAARDIVEGGEVSVSYTDALQPYNERAEKLERWGFKCECERCVFEESVAYCTAHLATRASEEIFRRTSRMQTLKLQSSFGGIQDHAVGAERIWSICEDLEWTCKHILNGRSNHGKQVHWLRTSFAAMYLAAYNLHAATQMSKDIPHAEEFVRSIQETLGACEYAFIMMQPHVSNVASTRLLKERLKQMSIALYGAQTSSALSPLFLLREKVYFPNKS